MNQPGYAEVMAPTHYFDRHFNTEAVKILPGEYFVARRDLLLVTVLGSCVAACIRDPLSGVGGMNHFLLPDAGDPHSPLSESVRYGSYAMEVLINQLLKCGASRSRLEAKVFGGAAVLRGFTTSQVGARNAEFVRRYLEDEGIRILAEDLDGIYPRKVYYFPVTGRVLIKRLKKAHNNTIVEREQNYERTLERTPIAGDVELF